MEGLFEFERDGRYALRRIPMIVRFKLDACGIRISLGAWIMLSRAEREILLALPSSSPDECLAYRQRIASMLQAHADNPDAVLEQVQIEAAPAWREVAVLPPQLVERAAELSLPLPTLQKWRELSDLQRFALIKLTRSGHKNANLLPALEEFGLTA